MVRKLVTKKVVTCDFCSAEHGVYYKCMGCSKDLCHDCNAADESMTAAVYFCGSGDAQYCKDCMKNQEVRNSPLFRAYQKIASLKDELNGFHARFKVKQTEADNERERLYNEWRKNRDD